MAQMTGQEKYRSDVERYANHLLDRQKTNSDGILYVHKWGTLRLGLFSYLSPSPYRVRLTLSLTLVLTLAMALVLTLALT